MFAALAHTPREGLAADTNSRDTPADKMPENMAEPNIPAADKHIRKATGWRRRRGDVTS
jgi:hypothetical protein